MQGIILLVILLVCIGLRFYCSFRDKGEISEIECSRVQLLGDEELQSDCLYSNQTSAGMLALAVDGIGRQGIGKVCARIAVKAISELYMSYSDIEKPEYFLSIAIERAHQEIKQFLNERYGGASIGCGIIKKNQLHYAVTGNVEIWLCRNQSLIPLTQGQTLDVLAKQSYENGRIDKETAIRACNEKRVYNYAGQETFQKIELCQLPIRLQERDLLLFLTKGVKETLTEKELLDCLSAKNESAIEKVSMISEYFARSNKRDRDNASVLLVQINRKKG